MDYARGLARSPAPAVPVSHKARPSADAACRSGGERRRTGYAQLPPLLPLERRWIDASEQRLHAPFPAELERVGARRSAHRFMIAAPDVENVPRHRLRIADRPQPTHGVGDSVDHGAGGDADDREARRLRFNDGNAERLVRHPGDVDVAARQPASQFGTVADVAGHDDPLILARSDLLAQRPFSDQRQLGAEVLRQALEGVGYKLRLLLIIETSRVNQQRLTVGDTEPVAEVRIASIGTELADLDSKRHDL